MKKIILASVLAVFVLAVALLMAVSLSGKPISPVPTGGRPHYVIGVDADYRPFSYVDEQGNFTGFDVESARWIAARKGFDPEFVGVRWNEIISALEQGKVDMIYSGLTITSERARRVDFTRPYFNVNQSVAIPAGSNATMEDFLSGRLRTGAQAGSTGAAWVEENLVRPGLMPPESLVLFADVPAMTASLEEGSVQAIIGDAPFLKTQIGGRPFTIAGDVATGEYYAIAVRKGDTLTRDMMDDGLSQLMADNYWSVLLERYGLSQPGMGSVPDRKQPATA